MSDTYRSKGKVHGKRTGKTKVGKVIERATQAMKKNRAGDLPPPKSMKAKRIGGPSGKAKSMTAKPKEEKGILKGKKPFDMTKR